MPRGNTELFQIVRAQALTIGGLTRLSREFPLGEGWHKLMARLQLNFTVGTGTTAISEGELGIIKSVRIVTDRGEILYNSVPGRILYRIDQVKTGTAAPKDAIAASTAVYTVYLNLWHVDPLLHVPEDSILNTARYSSLTFEITMGTVADLLGTPGTSSVTATLDMYVERSRGRLPKPIWPRFFQEIGLIANPVDASVLQTFPLERSADLGYKRLFLFSTAPYVAAGSPVSGPYVNTILNDITVDIDSGNAIDAVLADVVQRENKQFYSLEAVATGVFALEFLKDRSLKSGVYSGDKSRLNLKWTNQSLPGSPQVTAAYEAVRPLK